MNNPWKLVTRTSHGFGEDHCTQLAAAIAYHVLFSFIPLITVLLALAGLILRNPQQQQALVERILTMVPLQSDSLIYASISNISNQVGALTLIGVAGLLWASAGLFGAVRAALNIAWGATSRPRFFLSLLRDVGAVLGLGVLLIGSLVGTMGMQVLQTMGTSVAPAFAAVPLQALFIAAGIVLPAVFSFTAFLLLYRYVPNVRHSMGSVWPAALLATILFEVAKHGFAFYVAHFSRYQSMYGALGAIMLFMLWTYLSAIIMLIGAEWAAESDHMEQDRRVKSEPPGVIQGEPRFARR